MPLRNDDPRTFNPSDSEIASLARRLLPSIQAYFESEEGQREFAAWKAEKMGVLVGGMEVETKTKGPRLGAFLLLFAVGDGCH